MIPRLIPRLTCARARPSAYHQISTYAFNLPPHPQPSLPIARRASAVPRRAASTSRSTQFRDEDIPHRTITLVDPATSSLLPPAALADILIALDRARFSILLVDPTHDPPICKILDKKAEYAKAHTKKAAPVAGESSSSNTAPAAPAKNLPGPPKEVHLTWGVKENTTEPSQGLSYGILVTEQHDGPRGQQERISVSKRHTLLISRKSFILHMMSPPDHQQHPIDLIRAFRKSEGRGTWMSLRNEVAFRQSTN